MAKDTPFNSIRTMDVLIQEVCVNRSRPQIPQNWIPRLKNLISQCWDHDPLRRPPFSTVSNIFIILYPNSILINLLDNY